MGQSEREAFELQSPGFAQAWILRLDRASPGAVVAVASGNIDGRDRLQLVDQGNVMNVSAVEQHVGGVDPVPELRPEFSSGLRNMGVGDETNAHGC